MEQIRVTLRIPQALRDRLRRSNYHTHRPENRIVTQAIEHWLTHPLRPGCPNEDAAREWWALQEEQSRQAASQ